MGTMRMFFGLLAYATLVACDQTAENTIIDPPASPSPVVAEAVTSSTNEHDDPVRFTQSFLTGAWRTQHVSCADAFIIGLDGESELADYGAMNFDVISPTKMKVSDSTGEFCFKIDMKSENRFEAVSTPCESNNRNNKNNAVLIYDRCDDHRHQINNPTLNNTDKTLIADYGVLNGLCRGSVSPESRETIAACETRQLLAVRMLEQRNLCNGKFGQDGYQHEWHRCGRESYRAGRSYAY